MNRITNSTKSIETMKFLIALAALIVLAQAERDLSKLTPKSRTVHPKTLPPHIPKVTNGVEAEPHQFPFMAAVFIDGGSFCSGSIIAANKVLTAGHCCEGARSIEVIVGGHNIQTEEPSQQSILSKELHLHEDYDSFDISNDICVVTLSSDIVLDGETTSTVTLYEGQDSREGEEATVSGWGRPSDSVAGISPVLRHTSDKIISNDECGKSFNIVRDTNICLNGENGHSACNGDSGGPLHINKVEVGITSFGSAWGCSVGFPSAYTRVSSYSDWIKEKIQL